MAPGRGVVFFFSRAGPWREKKKRRLGAVSPSALLILNRASGTGHPAELAKQLGIALRSGYGASLEVQTAVVDDHPNARSAAAHHVAAAARPSLVVAAGGGGTLGGVRVGGRPAFPAG